MEDNEGQRDVYGSLEKCFALLRQKDSTSKLVGMTLMPRILQSQPSHWKECWANLDFRFIDRLLGAEPSNSQSTEEANGFISVALSVLLSFGAMDESLLGSKEVLQRLPSLLHAANSKQESNAGNALQLITRIVSTPGGAMTVVRDDLIETQVAVIVFWAEVASQAPEKLKADSDMLQVLRHGINCLKTALDTYLAQHGVDPRFCNAVQNSVPPLVGALHVSARSAQIALLDAVSSVLMIRPRDMSLDLTSTTRETLVSDLKSFLHRTANEDMLRMASIALAEMLQQYEAAQVFDRKGKRPEDDSKFVYLLCGTITASLRSQLPRIILKLNSPVDYWTMASHVGADFTILNSIITYIAAISEEESFNEDPADLLRLQRDLSEAFIEVIDYLRERWDLARAGAAGMHPDAIANAERPQLTWDTPAMGGVNSDPTIRGSIISLSLWVVEDESLREQAGGLADVFVGLLNEIDPQDVEYSLALLHCLEMILHTSNGRANFEQAGAYDAIQSLAIALFDKSDRSGGDEQRMANAIQVLNVFVDNLTITKDVHLKLVRNITINLAADEAPDAISVAKLELALNIAVRLDKALKRRDNLLLSRLCVSAKQLVESIKPEDDVDVESIQVNTKALEQAIGD